MVVCNFARIHLNSGKAGNLRPGDILGSLTKELGFKQEDVGKIFIFDHFSHVEINEDS
jgi:ATP-dependent RNA helicase DbpA